MLLALGSAASLAAQDAPRRSRSRAPSLFAFGAQFLRGNRVECAVSADGQLCSDVGSIFGAGFWPGGTPDQYIFKSGPQLAGIIPPTAGFAWASDTVGALIYDQRGTQIHGERVTLLFSSRDTSDLASWPLSAFIDDTSAFHALYIGRRAASQHDLWGRYWDGNPRFLSGRTHPMGIAIDQRALAWDHPEWNRDIVYFVLRVTNVTARDPALYGNPELAALGARFQDSSEAQLGVTIPDAGYAIDSLYIALSMDPDIGDAGHNNTSAILPFETALAYKSDFLEPLWVFPPEIYGQAPFTALPGFVGARFLRHPGPLALYTDFTGSASGFPVPVGVRQLWRYLSGNLGAGDQPCTVANHRIRKVCFLNQVDLDARFMMSHGPFRLAAGESRTVVLSYFFAAPLDTVRAYTSSRLRPGIPFTGDSIAADPSKVRAVERAAGWLGQTDANANNVIEASEVVTAPRSLLHKAQLAQAFADAKFLLPQPPVAPRFFLVPGDKQVTVVWQPSVTETAGDPYFPIAADRTSALYDPNFRKNDVEGYRVYRGTRPDRLELVAQFDYEGTELRDYTGNLFYPGRCAPEIGVLDECPVAFPATPDTTIFATRELRQQVIQVPGGGRIESSNGSIVTIVADTVGGARGVPTLQDTGVRFSYVDTDVGNGFTYFYAVTAFDVNSIRSGLSSMESAATAQHVAPRVPSGQASGAAAPVLTLLGADGSMLDPTPPEPAINAASGNFAGPMPPTNGLDLSLDVFLPEILGADTVTLTIDSIAPGRASGGVPAVYYVRIVGSAGTQSVTVPVQMDFFSSEASSVTHLLPVAAADKAARYGGDTTFVLPATLEMRTPGIWRLATWGRASANADPPNSDQNGPRWWNGTLNENTFAPNELQCAPANGSCVQGNLSRNSGRLTGVDTLFHLQAYSTVPSVPMRDLDGVLATVTRAADFRLYWGVNGAIDSVVDITHRVRVPFRSTIGPSWGILADSSFILAGTNQATTPDGRNDVLTWTDALCVGPSPALINQCGGPGQQPARLLDHVRVSPVSARSSMFADAATLPVTGLGFILYLNGHFFLMQAAPPLWPPGTVWHARFYSGAITGTAAAADYAFIPAVRPPAAPGLRARLTFTGSTIDLVRTNDSLLARVHTVPDPYYGTSAFEVAADTQRLAFVNLPARAIIRIYSVSGILVAALAHDDPTGGGEAYWNLRSRTGKAVASGVYFYHIETPDRRSKVGRFTVINAFAR